MTAVPRRTLPRPPKTGSSTGPRRPASTSSTSTACRASSTIPRSWRPAWRSSTTTTTAISTSTSFRAQMLGKKPLDQAVYPPTGPLKDRLFRNDLVVQEDGKRTLHFTDVTEQSGDRHPVVWDGRGDRRFQQRRLHRHLSHGTVGRPTASQQLRRDVHRRHQTERRRGPRRVGRFRGVRGLRPGRLAGSVRWQLSDLQPRGRHPLPES